MTSRPKDKVLVAAHDVGGAEIIGAYILKKRRTYNFVCCVSGPAVRVFERRGITARVILNNRLAVKSIVYRNRDARFVLTGTGWMTKMELRFIYEAKRQGLKVVSYLEHWGNYRERFGYPRHNWERNLPHEIWVGDRPAYRIATRLFPCRSVHIRMVPNEVFKEIKIKYAKAVRQVAGKTKQVLFASEPLSAPVFRRDKKRGTVTEHAILASILRYFSQIKFSQEIVIRLHPAEPKDKYSDLIKTFQGRLNLLKSNEPDMYKDLARASTVIGMESIFLVIALFCKKRVISFLPGKKECPLPFPRIIKIKKARELGGFMRDS